MTVKNPAAQRKRILEAATIAFSQHGFDGARVDEIARAAGVNKAMLYYHYGEKDRLYAFVLSETVDRILAALHEAVDPIDDPAEKLRAVARTIADAAEENPALAPMLLREIAAGGSGLPDDTIRKVAGIFQFVGKVLDQGRESGAFREVDPVITHMILVGSMLFLVAGTPIRTRIRSLTGGAARKAFKEPAPEDLAAHLSGLLLDGLRPAAPAGKPPRKTAPTRRPAR